MVFNTVMEIGLWCVNIVVWNQDDSDDIKE